MYDTIKKKKKTMITINPFNRHERDKNSECIIYTFDIVNTFNANAVYWLKIFVKTAMYVKTIN